jgi:hypothetical protein
MKKSPKLLALGLLPAAALGQCAPACAPRPAATCHPDYVECLPIVGDLDCAQVGHLVTLRDITVDPYDLDVDANANGLGCETGPIYVPPAAPTTTTTLVVYENCDAVRAAGAAPIHRGDPGYGSHLDRDSDGVGCEG